MLEGMHVVSDSITLKSYFLQVTLTIVTECQRVFVFFLLFFFSYKFFTNQSTNLPDKTLGFSVKPPFSFTLLVFPHSKDPEQWLSASKIAIPK